MHRHWWLGAVGFCLTFSSAAGARETGVEIGLRSGYALPFGGGSGDESLASAVSGVVPLWFDLGYRITPNVMVGAYFQYGFGFLSSDAGPVCDIADCSVNNKRLGAQVHYHFLPTESVDPWLGAGIGFEWLTLSLSGSVNGQERDLSVTAHGFEFVNLQGGVDFRPSKEANFGIGPFVALSIAEYSSCSASDGSSCAVRSTDVHEWLTLGIRGTFVP